MDKNQRKNIRRRKLTESYHRTQFIASYTEALHPDIHNKAAKMYEELKELYPGKRDVRKTPQYLTLTTGTKSLNAYYYRKKMSKKARQETGDNMVLTIPLEKYTRQSQRNNPDETSDSTLELTTINSDPTSDSTLELTTINSDPTSDSTLELTTINSDPTSDSTLELTTINSDPTSPSTVVLTSTNPNESNSPAGELTSGIIPDHIYNNLLAELTKDPDLADIFNDFDDILKEDDIINNYQDIDEPTPLEWELHNMGY